MLLIKTSCLPDKVLRVLEILSQELELLRHQPLTNEEIDRARSSLRHQSKKKWRDLAGQAMFLAEQRLVAGETKTHQQFGRALRQVTPLRIQRLARALFRPERMNAVLLGPGIDQLDRRKVVRTLRGS